MILLFLMEAIYKRPSLPAIIEAQKAVGKDIRGLKLLSLYACRENLQMSAHGLPLAVNRQPLTVNAVSACSLLKVEVF
jgi:hypothetical protein